MTHFEANYTEEPHISKTECCYNRMATATKCSCYRDVPVAQLDRVSDSDSEGHAFESHQAYQTKYKPSARNLCAEGLYLVK